MNFNPQSASDDRIALFDVLTNLLSWKNNHLSCTEGEHVQAALLFWIPTSPLFPFKTAMSHPDGPPKSTEYKLLDCSPSSVARRRGSHMDTPYLARNGYRVPTCSVLQDTPPATRYGYRLRTEYLLVPKVGT